MSIAHIGRRRATGSFNLPVMTQVLAVIIGSHSMQRPHECFVCFPRGPRVQVARLLICKSLDGIMLDKPPLPDNNDNRSISFDTARDIDN